VRCSARSKTTRSGELDGHLNPASIRRNIVLKYGEETGISAEVNGLCVHSLRATAATNALAHESDIAKVQEFPPHGFTTVAEAGRKIARRSA